MRSMSLAFVVLLLMVGNGQAQPAKTAREPLADRVKKAIDSGISYLRKTQKTSINAQRERVGHWEIDSVTSDSRYEGGQTCLALLGLLNAGVPAKDEAVQNGLRYIRVLKPKTTYVRALQTMVFAEAKQTVDHERIRENVLWLAKARVLVDGELRGWSYYDTTGGRGDNSNSQYALLGLWAAKQAGIDVEQIESAPNQRVWPTAWRDIRNFYEAFQDPKGGGWPYVPGEAKGGITFQEGTYLTMTSAGASGLLIAGEQLNKGREIINKDGTVTNCGVYTESESLKKALRYIDEHFILEMPVRNQGVVTYYNLYGLERVGRLTGMRFIGKHDWYREGCEYLVEKQHEDGSWYGNAGHDRWRVVSTGFALLFLSKGRTPVLISRVVHGQWPREGNDGDWNNDRNAIKHLTEFCSKQLFQDVPLAWQNYDIARAVVSKGGALTDEVNQQITADMLQSPILFINGHKSLRQPQQRLGKNEIDILVKYVESGGFIFANACCGSKEFDQGFQAFVRDAWGTDLEDVPKDSPIWSAFFLIKNPDKFKLQCVRVGCRIAVVYCPVNVACWWESNRDDDPEGVEAFRLGANIVAYATGMQTPQPRLTPVEIIADKKDPPEIPRGYLQVAQLQYSNDSQEWQPAPKAMQNLMNHLHKQVGVDVVFRTQPIPIDHEFLIDHKFIYMHGRKGEFRFDESGLKNLRQNLESGGLLFADACCGSSAFDAGFRKFAKELFPKQELQQVPINDVLFSDRFNGKAVAEVKCRKAKAVDGKTAGYEAGPPFLEGIKVNNRWVILYSKYDIGCALERQQSPDCLGYDHDSALRIGSAAVMYLVRPLSLTGG